jgi:hypothetical protein
MNGLTRFHNPGQRVVLILLLLMIGTLAHANVSVVNFKPEGETLRYPIALLRGKADGEKVRVVNRDNPNPDGTNETAVSHGSFSLLVELRSGVNHLTLTDGKEKLTLALSYQPMTTHLRVNVIYVTAEDGDTHYLSQFPEAKQNYENKLDTALKLMQTFTAESLNDAGLGRKTFALEFDKDNRVVVHTLKYPLAKEMLREKTGNQLFDLFYPWTDKQFPMERCKNVVVMAFTGYDPVKKQPRGHTALGGGGQGLFSSNGMFAWPENIHDVPRAFTDPTPVNDTLVWDDTAYRSTLWALASTTIGATLHEMGHTFGLPHSPDGESIMSRGFDHFNRAFIGVESPTKGRNTPLEIKPNQIACWDLPFAARLSVNPWFQPDETERKTDTPPTVTFDAATEEIVIHAPYGILGLEYEPPEIESLPVTRRKFELFNVNPPTELRLKRAKLRDDVQAPKGVNIIVTDTQGNIVHISEAKL